VGRRIRVPEVRVIGADGSQVGILPTHEAMRLAEEQGLELVEVNPRAAPPVCKIMDFGKFKYETSKKEKASKKHQSKILLKEIKLRPKTDDHDLDFKVKHIRRFLSEGNKCKLVTVFRGREIVHPETGQAMLDSVMKMVATFFGETGKAVEEYYFWNGKLIFVFSVDNRYDKPLSGKVARKTEGRFYFKDDKLIKWLGGDGKEVASDSSEFAVKQTDYLKIARQLSEGANSKSPTIEDQ